MRGQKEHLQLTPQHCRETCTAGCMGAERSVDGKVRHQAEAVRNIPCWPDTHLTMLSFYNSVIENICESAHHPEILINFVLAPVGDVLIAHIS
jgi:hypothetical protein